jgi:glycosyltransferase involved in cell wall biosynthesis
VGAEAPRRVVSEAVRLALLTEIPAPYRVPLFRALAERVDLRVLFLAAADPRRPYYDAGALPFPHCVLKGRDMRRGERWVVANRGVIAELRRFRPDTVAVGGWNQPAFWQALAYCRLRRIPLLLWVESTARDARSEAVPLRLARRAMIAGASGYFVPGRASADYVRSFGVPEELIAEAPNAVDAATFAAAAGDRAGRAECTFLYVGRLDPEKGLDLLLRAFREVPGRLVLVGTGGEEARLHEHADGRVRFAGAATQEEVAAAYAEADVFVLPSRSEPWGMVLNEAAAAGLPIVTTEEVGAAEDLVEEGENGFRVPAGDEQALAQALRRLAEDEPFRLRAGERSRELVARFTPEAWAEGVAGLAKRLARP